MRTRAERRHVAQQQKRRARQLHGVIAHIDPRHVERAAKSPRACSCWKCRKEAHHYSKPTLQELRASDYEREFEQTA